MGMECQYCGNPIPIRHGLFAGRPRTRYCSSQCRKRSHSRTPLEVTGYRDEAICRIRRQIASEVFREFLEALNDDR